MFFIVMLLAERAASEDIRDMGGIASHAPVLAALFLITTFATLAIPGSAHFVGEFLILLGTFKVSTLECTLAATALFLGPAYMLYLYRRVIFGTITRADLRNMLDLSPREKAVFAPLLVLVLWMGVYPNSFLRPIQVSVDHLVQQVNAATQAAGLRRASLY
jgi:NADH-quinone oxidoreductase subunit M